MEDTRTGVLARFAFLRSPVRVGRAPESDVPLAEPFVSARHGLLQFDDGGVVYADLGSRNGTALDGAPLAPDAPARVGPDSDLRIGPLRLSVSLGAPRSDASEAVPQGALTALMERLARVPELDAAEVAARRLHPGLALGRFELVREIGRGGLGIVFEAQDTRLHRRVALKALPPGERPLRLGEASLQREAEAAARLAHPNIVALHDVGMFEGGPFLVMELLRGDPLDARLARGPLDPGVALAVAIDVARALAHAHAAGVVHRDLKPSNVFLVEEGFAKVLDFGLAHVFGAAALLRGGRSRYLAPEQREDGPPDPRADVHAAALLLVETLAGRLPDDPAEGVRAAGASAPVAAPGMTVPVEHSERIPAPAAPSPSAGAATPLAAAEPEGSGPVKV